MLFFIGVMIFSITLHYKNKKINLEKFKNGNCPSCREITTFKIVNNKATGKEESILINPIKKRILRAASCSPGEVEYYCESCKCSEVFTEPGGNCGI